MSDSPGQTRTKFCPTCARHLPLDQFTRLTSSPDGLRSRCKTCWQEVNDRCNGVSAIAYALVGGSKQHFYSLPRDARLAVRRHAMRLYDAGADFVTAVQRTDVTDGFVYIITHPAWPDYLKIGCAINPESRLRDYQTYCPHRAFVLEHVVYCSDRREAEAKVHALFAAHRASGEWFRVPLDEARAALNSVASPLHNFRE